MSTPDPFDLARFVSAQVGVHERACRELLAGRKASHWMWFVFPQMQGLGRSGMAWEFGISSIDEEARAYLGHPILGPRLIEVTRLALGHSDKPLRDVFGTPDDLKFHSSMTLFVQVAGADTVFAEAIEKLCQGALDEPTVALLANG